MIWISATFLCALSMQTMEHDCAQLVKYKQCQTSKLFLLPDELLIHIFTYCSIQDKKAVYALKKSIQNFMQLSTLCKKFNQLLKPELAGQLCQQYPSWIKDHILQDLIYAEFWNPPRRLHKPISILTLAGAYINDYYLLQMAALWNDAQLAEKLFHRGADPNIEPIVNIEPPVFFYVKTKKLAKMFIENNANIHATEYYTCINVLWYTTKNKYPYELMQFYLQKGVNPYNLHAREDSCLLHELAQIRSSDKMNVDNFLNKAKLLLNAIPNLINTLSKDKLTPLDVAKKTLKQMQKYSDNHNALKKLIIMYKQHGGLTAFKLTKKEASLPKQKTEPQSCTIS